MFSESRTPLVHSASAALHAVLLVVFFAPLTQAQIGDIDSDPGDRGTGGRNAVQGSIHLPSGNRAERQFRVRLSGIRGDLFMLSDTNGAFTFRRLAGGSYQLTVEASQEFEAASQTIDVIDTGISRRGETRAGQTVIVQIQLRLRAASGSKPGVINAALAGVPKAAIELYQKALNAAQAGERKKAIEHLKDALGLYPQFALALNELGVQHMRLGENDKALDALRAALKLAPEALPARLNYGIALVQKKQFAEAEAELRRALEKNEASAVAHLYRGRALIGLRNYPEAQKELQRVIAIGGEEVGMAHRFMGALYIEVGENVRAVGELEEYLRLVPKAKDADQIREILKGLSETPKR